MSTGSQSAGSEVYSPDTGLSRASTFDNEKSTPDLAGEALPYGLFELSSPPDPSVDIIFVHGLHGHPRETWQASSKRTKVFWPKDLLAPHLSSPNFSVQARILSFGYNSCHLLDGSKLRELTNHLAQEVLAKRSGSAASRQIIWIAHSLGGVLVKAVLKLSHRFSNDDFGTGPSSILRATIGVIFLGTPHQVSSPATWMNYIILASGENPITNLGGVKVAVEDYQRHAVSFRALLDHQRIIIVSFYESKPTPTKQGLIKVVDELTALNHSLETIRYIEGNHRTICQFTDDCQVGYIQIRRAIVEILKSGVEVQASKWPSESKPYQTLESTQIIEDDLITWSTGEDTVGLSLSLSEQLLLFRRSLGAPTPRWELLSQRIPGTCEWIKSSEKFNAWKNFPGKPRKPILCIEGPSGSGKTVLSAYLAQELVSEMSQMSFQSTANILSFFFEFKETSHGSVLALVKSLLSQLLDSNQALIRQIPWKENPSHRQDLESLTDILFSILRNSDFQITCIIDGLDECENESLETLVNFIVNLSRIPSARAILTYCQGSEVGRRIGQCEAYSRMVTLDLSNQNTEDVAKYTKERCIDFATKRELPEDVKRKLLASLENHHNGRFVWVTLILQLLGRFRKVGDIKTFLDHLPVELPVVYKTLLDGVTTEKKPNMYRSLYYLQCAARPLSVRELSMCLGIEDTMAETTKLMDNLEINLEDDLRTELGRALVFDEGNVFFAHPDLGQFIGDGKMGSLGEEKTMKEIHFELAYACLVYLTMGDLLQELPGELLDLLQKPPEEFRRILINGASFDEYYTEIFKRIPLLEYACYYWPYHLSHSEELALGASTVVEKLLKKNIEFPFWQNIFRSSPSAPTHFPTSTTRRDILSSLNLAKLLKKPDSTMTNNLDYRNVLHYAVKNSAFQSFEFYLSLTKDPGGSDERNKLALACIREHADEQKKAGFYAIIQKYQHSEIPLQIPRQNIDIHGAVRSQNSDSLNTAIRASGGNVNAKDPFGYTALHYAIDMQLLSMVTILMKCGADPEVKDPRGRCSLHSAAEKGDAKIASLLLEFGAKSDAIDHSNQTALHYSALRGSLDVTKLLVQWRANTSPKDKKRQTPMHFAASFGNIHIVKLLVDCVSKVSELDSKLRTPLFTACSHGRMPAVKLLLELGIGSDIFLPDIHGQHPLHVAARNGHLEILTLLLSSGVKSSPRDNRRRTPLHEAALRGELPMVQRLLKFHADYALVDMDGRTPLHDACRSPFPSDDVVKQLLESGASWNARDQEGRRPIHYAARSGKAVVIEDLLDAAEQLNLDPEDSEPSYINSQDFQGRTPLHMAVYLEHPNSVLQLLMRHGCLAEMTDVDGKTALQLAIELKCHDATVFLRAQKATPRFSLSDLFPLPSGYSHPRLLAHQDSRLLKIYHPSKDAGENAPILCSFVQLCLHQDEARGFEYDALSYWWGTDEPTNKIWVLHYIRGSERTRTKLRLSPVYIRSNLYSALKQFRHPTKDLYLWVDALCIDQKNKDEKSSHVLKIRDIYAAAKQVRIWLGPSSSMRAKALRVLYPDLDLSRRFQSEHTQSWEEQLNALTTLTRNRWFSRLWVIQEMFFAEKAIIQCGSFEGSWNRFADVSSKLHLELSRTHRYVIHEQPLRRAWALLLQSFGDAKSLLKGQRQYRLPDLNTSNIDDTQLHVQNDSKKLIPQEEEIGYKSAISVGVDSKMTLHSGFSLEMLVTALTPFETSDPRDTVYAVMGIANDTTKYSKPLQSPYNVLSSPKTDFDIIPDYNRSIIDVFIEFVRFCVLSSHSLDIICRPWAPQPQEKYLTTLERVRNVKEPARAVNIPSWIVMNSSTAFKQSDFLQGRRGGDSFVGAPRRPLYSASQTTDAFARFPLKSTEDASRSRLMESFDGSIQVRGVRIGHVDILGPRAVEGMLFRENLELLGWTPVDDKFQDGQISDRLWRTLVADRGPDGTPPPAWYKAACAHALELRNNMGDVHTSALIADREEEESSELVQFLRRVQSVIWNRKPFGTTRGYVGIAPSRTSQGDVICVLLGCSVPVILRKMHQIGNCYELIGESYVHGIMDGEALELGVIEDFELR